MAGLIITDESKGSSSGSVLEGETGINIYGNGAIDRSPCGAGTAARVALAVSTASRHVGQKWAYNSPISAQHQGQGAFVATPQSIVMIGPGEKVKAVVVEIEAKAWYTAATTFTAERKDTIAASGLDFSGIIDGFLAR